MSIHRFQEDPTAPSYCKCGYHKTYPTHAALDVEALPMLYEACKVALESLRAWNTMGMKEGLPETILMRDTYEESPEIKALKAAIAKAEGASGAASSAGSPQNRKKTERKGKEQS